MTRVQAQYLINSYCDDVPPDEEAAIQRLMAAELSDFDELNMPGEADLQDRLDGLIYGLLHNP